MKLKTLILFLLIYPQYAYPGDEWTFEYAYKDNFLFLHSLVNYSYDISWKYDYQRNLIRSNSLALNFSSVTTADLMTDSYLNINQSLGGGWRFKSAGQYRANRFENEEVKYLGLGFEKTIISNIGLFFLFNPTYEKEENDVSFGTLVTSENREIYFVAEVELEDFLFNEKDDFGGKYLKEPVNFKWQLRYVFGRFTLFSNGRISTGFERTYDDIELSPELRFHSQKINSTNVTLAYNPGEELLTAVSYDHYSFSESKNYTAEEENYIYDNSINRISAECIYTFLPLNNIRILTNYIIQDAGSRGFREHDYTRKELASGIFYMRYFSEHALEAGFMMSIFDWKYVSYPDQDNYSRTDNSSKVMLAYHYTFKNNARFIFSISHEIDTEGFGGGNLQYIMFF